MYKLEKKCTYPRLAMVVFPVHAVFFRYKISWIVDWQSKFGTGQNPIVLTANHFEELAC